MKIIDALEVSLSDFFLPYSVPQDTEMMELLLKIQKHPKHKMIVHKVMEILELSQDR